MTHHFVAQVRTTAGPLKIGISNIPAATIGPAFQALMTTLAQVSDPILPEDPDAGIDIYEVLDRSPEVAMQFEYLGTNSVTFPDAEAFHASMNQAIAGGRFQCPASYDEHPDGSIEVVFQTFLLAQPAAEDS
jgi:hypothetical protein